MSFSPIWSLGLMSGTSLDGVDCALLKTEGEGITEFGPSYFARYEDGALEALPHIMRDPLRYRDSNNPEDRACLALAETEVLRLHARAVTDLLVHSKLVPDLVGFHGQTVHHAPEDGWTWQLGDGDRLSQILNRSIVWDFRTADVEAGGEGAPLAPFFHFALAKNIGADEPLCFLNIGGVANLTWVDPRKSTPDEEGALLAFDTGPGNALLNDFMHQRVGEYLDRDGAAAAIGDAQSERFKTNRIGDFLARPAPKSLDRNAFSGLIERTERLSVNDGAAALTALTVRCVAEARAHLPAPPSRWLVCGGGRQNPVMMRMLSAALDGPVQPVEAAGLDGDMLEAQAFAWLAVRALRGLPLSAPSTTGCPSPITGGRLSAITI